MGIFSPPSEFLCHGVTAAFAPEDKEDKETKEPGGRGRKRNHIPNNAARLLPISSCVLRQLFELEKEKEGETVLTKDCLAFYPKGMKNC